MGFSSKRGRPRKPAVAPDLGTAELRLKQALSLTAEPIDICLARRIITDDQHRAGMHFRWLHTLRYGAPCVTTRYARDDITSPVVDDLEWRASREQEYADAVLHLLRSHRRHDLVMRLVVFNEMPLFLNLEVLKHALGRPAVEANINREREQFVDGLMLLENQWKP